MRYQLPVTDPRWLEATDADILADATMVMYAEDTARRAADPKAEAAAQARRGGSAEAEKLITQVREALSAGGSLLARIRQFEAARAKKVNPMSDANITAIRGARRAALRERNQGKKPGRKKPGGEPK